MTNDFTIDPSELAMLAPYQLDAYHECLMGKDENIIRCLAALDVAIEKFEKQQERKLSSWLTSMLLHYKRTYATLRKALYATIISRENVNAAKRITPTGKKASPRQD